MFDMETLQTTDTEEIDLDLDSEGDKEDEMKATNTKSRKELFQINTHPATVIAANNKRDRRLKQIVMRVVAFCKREHEEGQQVPFRFFKKRASLMTGVSLSTIHRIETIDMKAPPSPKREPSSKIKLDDQKKPKKKKKKSSESLVQQGSMAVQQGNMTVQPGNMAVQQGNMLVQPGNMLVQQGNMAVQPGNMAVQSGNIVDGNLGIQQIHYQAPNPTAKPSKKRKKKASVEIESTGGVTHNHSDNTTTIITSDLTLQPTVLHAVTSIGEGGVATINVQNAAMNNVTPAQQRVPCTWTAGLGPFTVSDLRDHHVQLPAGSQLQVNAQHVPAVGSTISVGGHLQPISVATAPQQATFTGQLDTSNVNWATGTVGSFGTLQTTATLVGQPVMQGYSNTGQIITATPQQTQQVPTTFYQF